jgi:hypothetical protein
MSELTNSLAGKTNANPTIEEAPVYIIVKDGYGVEHKVINLDNPKNLRTEGIIVLSPTRSSTRHATRVRYTTWQNPMTGIHYGIFTGVNNKTKELMFQSILLSDEETLDLSNPRDAKKWAVLQFAPFLQGSPNFKVGHKTQYKIVDKEQEANQYLAGRKFKRKAIDISEGLVGEALVDMARDLGMDPKSYSVPTLHAELIKISEENPKRFMDIWDSPSRTQLTIFKRGLATGIISQDLTGLGFMFGAHSLGTTEGSAIDYLRQHVQLGAAIDNAARLKESDSVKAMAAVKPTELPKTGDDAKFQRLMEELEAMKEMNKTLSEKLMTAQIEATGTIESDDELNELRIIAKSLGVKNPGIYGKEKLKAKVEELQAQKA